MNQLDFSQFKAPDAINRKKAGGSPTKVQSFQNLKYRKAKSKTGDTAKFYISESRFNELALELHQLLAVIHPTTKQVLLGVCEEGKGNLLKKRENGKIKGHGFKSDTVEAALLATNVIENLPVGSNQFLDMTVAGTNITLEGVLCSTVFLLSKGEAIKASTDNTIKSTILVSETPVKAPTSAAEAPKVTADVSWE